jgi:hypothetical protein
MGDYSTSSRPNDLQGNISMLSTDCAIYVPKKKQEVKQFDTRTQFLNVFLDQTNTNVEDEVLKHQLKKKQIFFCRDFMP